MRHPLTFLFAFALVGCATSAPVSTPAITTLSDQAFKALRDPIVQSWDAFKKPALAKADADLSGLLQREDLSAEQRAQIFYDRGFARGLFVRDYPQAWPQCAVLDYREMEKLAPNHLNIDKMRVNRSYQFARFKFFGEAPAECVSGAQAYAAELGD